MTLNELAERAHTMAVDKGFWDGYKGTDDIQYLAMKIVLIHAELSEAVEAMRKHDGGNFREEIADTFIRLGDLANACNIDVDAECKAKMTTNANRPHKHGKRF